mgnify:CR=1 FL=1
MKLMMAQQNYTIGDISKNTRLIIDQIEQARSQGCDLIVFSELAISGYPPLDLLFYESFIEDHQKAIESITTASKNITTLVGTLRNNPGLGKPLFNSCAMIQNGELVDYYDKQLLPTYDVFDERRYFEPGRESKCIDVKGLKVGLTICEDILADEMHPLYDQNPIEALKKQKPDLVVSLNASPFELNKPFFRYQLAQSASKKLSCPVALCNQVGGNDSLLFDGHSVIVDSDQFLATTKGFAPDHCTIDFVPHQIYIMKHTFQ